MKISKCRLCEGPLSAPVIDLGETPLANCYVESAAQSKELESFPLQVCMCKDCCHFQLNEQIEPEKLFSTYLYATGHSAPNKKLFEECAAHLVGKLGLQVGSRVLDIASNDGTLLSAFKASRMSVLGVEPAGNLAGLSINRGIETIPEFFSEELANRIFQDVGEFDLITAHNVFAHIPNPLDFARGVKRLLAPGGTFVFEVSYFLDVAEKNLFDTIYHEHTSYHTVGPLIGFFDRLGMQIVDVECIPNHGGSIRVYVELKTPWTHSTKFVRNLTLLEGRVLDEAKKMNTRVSALRLRMKERLGTMYNSGAQIAIFGAPAKATTFIHALNINPRFIEFAVDDMECKQGKCIPGTDIRIEGASALDKTMPGGKIDTLLICAWNFSDAIIQRFDGHYRYIVPLPEYKEVTF